RTRVCPPPLPSAYQGRSSAWSSAGRGFPFGASSLTMQKAMTLLKQDGWAVSRPGKGAFVAQYDHVADDADDFDGQEASAPVGGMAAHVEALERALADAAQQIADLRSRVEALESASGVRGHCPAAPRGPGRAFRFSLRGSRRPPPAEAGRCRRQTCRSIGRPATPQVASRPGSRG
ncbi:hypothetical protein ACFRFN_46130, partial [Streptomyces mirabilis]